MTYVERVNRAIDYIVLNLERPLSLELVAKAAFFSPFHFHRVFRSLTGETLNEFVKRLRLERALGMLAHGGGRSLTDIALSCGFGSSSDFSRSFKQRYGVAPSGFDLDAHRRRGREELQEVVGAEAEYRLDRLPGGTNPDGFEVRLRAIPERVVAYLRVADSFRPGAVPDAAERMVKWAEDLQLADGQWLGYMWDDPELVALHQCRYDVGLEVDELQPTGEIGRFEFPAMLVAEVEVRGAIDVEQRALDWLFGTWLPHSGYVPAAHPVFEAWDGRPFAHGMEHFELRVQLPVERG